MSLKRGQIKGIRVSFLYLCIDFWLCAAIRTKHHKNEQHKSERKTANHKAGENFTEGRIKYKFLHQSRTGLNLDAYVVSSDF